MIEARIREKEREIRRCYTAGLEGGAWGIEPGTGGGPWEARKIQNTDSPLEHAKGTELHRHLDFNPVRPVLDFPSPEP